MCPAQDLHNSDEVLNDIEEQINDIYARISIIEDVITHPDSTPKQRRQKLKYMKELRYELLDIEAQYDEEKAIRHEYINFYHPLLQQE